MAKQMNPNDLAGIAIIFSKRQPSESPVFISYCGSKEWRSTYKPSGSLFGGGFASYMMNLQSQANPDNINKNFDIYPKDIKVDRNVIATMRPSIALIDFNDENMDPQNIGLLVMLCVTSTTGFSIPKELKEKIGNFHIGYRESCLMMEMEEYKHHFYPHSTSKELREVREKMREFMGMPVEDETDNTSSIW